MSVSRRATVLGLLVALIAAASAPSGLAQTVPSVAPPGNSAVDQYRESLPPASSNARKLGSRDRTQLERQGRDGRALATALDRAGGVPQAAEPPSGAAGSDGHPSSRGGASGRRSNGDDESSRSGTRGRGDSSASSSNGRSELSSSPIAPAAAASTVGPVPVWVLLVAAAGLVGIGLVLRTRAVR